MPLILFQVMAIEGNTKRGAAVVPGLHLQQADHFRQSSCPAHGQFPLPFVRTVPAGHGEP